MTVSIKTLHGWLRVATVNGREVIVNRITEIALGRPGHYSGIAAGAKFKIEGGKQAGGTSREWFVQWDSLAPDAFPTQTCL